MILNSFRGSGCYIESKYIDIADLGPKLIKLVHDKVRYVKMCEESRTVSKNNTLGKKLKV